METVRAFIAVDIGDEIRGRLDELQRRLKKCHADIRWVHPRSIHLTLVFLGQVPVEQLDAIRLLLDQACAGQQPFEIEARGTGTFGKPGRPRVVWAGISACPPLKALQNGIVQQLHQAAIAFDNKPFSPHLTLGRIKAVDRHLPPLMEKLDHFRESALGRARIGRVALIQSRLTPRGADYAELHAVELI